MSILFSPNPSCGIQRVFWEECSPGFQMDRYLTLLRLLLAAHATYRRFTRTSLSQVHGPKSTPFLFGGVHKRYREILNPGFGAAESLAFLAISQASARAVYQSIVKIVAIWMELFSAGINNKIVLGIPSWVPPSHFGCHRARRVWWSISSSELTSRTSETRRFRYPTWLSR
ncbi:hypothetical protein EDD17DRAFT_1626845 [Pisolithus thermaeus]|nr:hypothetical protein EDD17DRAFT_1626845 [Pisolithus thermaeus]